MPSYAGTPAPTPHAPRGAAHRVVGHGTSAGCTSTAVRRAVAKGGLITFDCGPDPVTIVMDRTAMVHNDAARKVVIDGGGLVTLSGGGKRRILYQNTCDQRLTWTTSHCQDQATPKLVLRNLTFTRGNATGSHEEGGGGGAVFVRGGRLTVVELDASPATVATGPAPTSAARPSGCSTSSATSRSRCCAARSPAVAAPTARPCRASASRGR